MIELRIAEILQEKGISKTEFADMMGIKKQNVNVLLETNNIKKLDEIANVLRVELTDLWKDKNVLEPSVNGFVEINGEVFTIKSIEDYNRLYSTLNN
ncbi:MAG: helix-turn-helix transcriptional regulator [Bacteroides sp.]|nr:helix-turn-helix transcriptional regulator [Bacteroides sp.]